MADFLEQFNGFKDSDNSWTIDLKDVDKETFDLSVKNPNVSDEIIYREPKEILQEITDLDRESESLLTKIKELI